MVAYTATIVAALIGALLGSIGSAYVQSMLRRADETRLAKERIVERYLLQLRGAVEALWYRFHNLSERGGKLVMSDEYFEVTSLYALGRVLAYERILLWDGVYLQLKELRRFDPTLSRSLRARFHQMEHILDNGLFQRYHRLALAEAVTDTAAEFRRTRTFLDFKQVYTAPDSPQRPALEPAKKFVSGLDGSSLGILLGLLKGFAEEVARTTGMPTTIPR